MSKGEHVVRQKSWWLPVLIVLAVAGLGMGARYYWGSSQYLAVKPTHGDLTEAVYGLGKVKSNHRFDVKLGVVSTVRKLHVREGQIVKKGDKLIEFDSGTVFRAPFDGTVTLVAAWDGETAPAQVTVLRLEDLKDRYIEISLEQEGALRIRLGQPAKVSFETLRGKTLLGKVTSLYSKDDEFLAQVETQDLDETVLPGMTADVSIEIGTIKNALLIPVKAINNGMVLIERNGRREKVKVDVGHIDGLSAEILGDTLKPDDRILVLNR